MSENTNKDAGSQALEPTEVLYYPSRLESDLSKGTSMLKFTIIERRHREIMKHIYLPSPNSFNLNDGASYDSLDKGDIQQAFGGAASLLGQVIRGEGARGGDAAGAESFTADLAVTGLLFGGGIPVIGGSMNEIAFQAGAAANKQERTRFVGNAIRTFSFQIELSPESSDENKKIVKILDTFRRYLYASKGTNVLALDYPPEFLVEFYNGKTVNTNFPVFAPAYLESIQTTYNPNTFALHTDGGAETYTLNLTFKESRKLIREEIDELKANQESNTRHQELYKNQYLTADQVAQLERGARKLENEEIEKLRNEFLDEHGGAGGGY